jgi:hypothetical protein
VRADAQSEAALLEILERFCSGFATRDAERVIRLFAPDDDVVMVTSEESVPQGPAEVSAFRRRYAQGTADGVGWLLAQGTETAASAESEEKHPYRMTLVCEQRDGRWLLPQIHGSSPQSG